MLRNILSIPCYVFTISFKGDHYRLGKYVPLTSKRSEIVLQERWISQSLFSYWHTVSSYNIRAMS